MKVKYLSFSENNTADSAKTAQMIASAVSKATGTQAEAYDNFSDFDLFEKKFEEELKLSNVIVLCVDNSAFIKAKGTVCKALELKCKKDNTILRMIESGMIFEELNDNQKIAHAAVPVDARVFITNDGLYSGFAVKQPNQRIIILPAEERRTDARLLVELADYLSSDIEEYSAPMVEEKAEEAPEAGMPGEEYAISDLFGELENDETEDEANLTENPIPEFENVPAQTDDVYSSGYIDIPLDDDYEAPLFNEAEKGVEIVSAEAAEKIGNDFNIIPTTLENILKANIRIALELPVGNEVFTDYVRSVKYFAENPNFAIVPEDNEVEISTEEQCKQAVSDSARSAMEKADSNVGMALSDVYSSDDGKNFIYAALCDSSKTNVYKIFAMDGEDPSSLVDIGMNSLFEVLNKRVVEYLRPSGGKAGKKKMSIATQITIWVVAVAIIVTIMAVVIRAYFTPGTFIYEKFASNAFIAFNNIFSL